MVKFADREYRSWSELDKCEKDILSHAIKMSPTMKLEDKKAHASFHFYEKAPPDWGWAYTDEHTLIDGKWIYTQLHAV